MRRLAALLDAGSPDPVAIEAAVEALALGQVVAFATDTAYGLGARPDSPEAVEAIYALKGRPAHMPLILLASDASAFDGWAELDAAADSLASRLAREFWPGPLTLVVPSGPRSPLKVATPEGTVGVRVPAHLAARALLGRTGPLATTSANRSGGPSPRSADDVEAQLGGDPLLAILLDAGPTHHGADSTVLSLVGEPRILRAGALTAGQLGLPV